MHISEICQVWRLGIRLVSVPRFELFADLRNNIIGLGITHLGMVPSMIEATLGTPEDLPLKYMASGGEKISDAVSAKKGWCNTSKFQTLYAGTRDLGRQSKNHPCELLRVRSCARIQSSGVSWFPSPTEVTIGCVSRKVSAKDRKENIGQPFPACSAYIVNSKMEILPLGVAGELVIEGPLVARGYHRLPEVTAKSFTEWPTKGCRAYRTGDLGILVTLTADS